MIQNNSAAYLYDAENRIVSSAGYTYIYDGDGRRVEKCITPDRQNLASCAGAAAGNGTLYWLDNSLEGLESDLGQNWTEVYVKVNGKRLGQIDWPAGQSGPGNGLHFYMTDMLGSADEVTDEAGNIQKEADYYPYGGEIPVSGSDPAGFKHKFTGKERDAETGLDNFGARYFTSNLGRFMTPDWAARPTTVPYAVFGDPQSLNLYGYVRNDPVSQADADGHCPPGIDCNKITVDAAVSEEPQVRAGSAPGTASVEGQVQYTFKYTGNAMKNMPVHEEVSNKSFQDGQPVKAGLTTSDAKTNNAGVVGDTSSIDIKVAPLPGLATTTLSTSVFTKETTQVLSFNSPSGSACTVTEQRTMTNADKTDGTPSSDYRIDIKKPTQTASPAPPPPPPQRKPGQN